MNLSTTYLGMKLRSPLVASASRLSEDLGKIKRLEGAGASAIVLYSLFEEQLTHIRIERDKQNGGSLIGDPFPKQSRYALTPEGYLVSIYGCPSSIKKETK
jgi:dihydroorotate dehydrogenase (fumarate)